MPSEFRSVLSLLKTNLSLFVSLVSDSNRRRRLKPWIAVDVFDAVTGQAGNSRVGGGMVFVIEVNLVECTAEQSYRVVATGAKACCVDVTVALEGHSAGVAHRKQVRGIIE